MFGTNRRQLRNGCVGVGRDGSERIFPSSLSIVSNFRHADKNSLKAAHPPDAATLAATMACFPHLRHSPFRGPQSAPADSLWLELQPSQELPGFGFCRRYFQGIRRAVSPAPLCLPRRSGSRRLPECLSMRGKLRRPLPMLRGAVTLCGRSRLSRRRSTVGRRAKTPFAMTLAKRRAVRM